MPKSGAVLKWIDEHAGPLGAGLVPLDDAPGRVLAEPVVAPIDVPAFDRAAMDGYALHAHETSGASDYHPLAFAIVGQALPGRPFDGTLVFRVCSTRDDGRADSRRRRCDRAGRVRRIAARKR